MIARPEDTPEPLPEPEPKPGNNGHKGGNGKAQPQTQAERLAELHRNRKPGQPITPKAHIPVRTMASMQRYLAALEGCGDHLEACRRARVGKRTVEGWWPERFPAFVAMRDAALARAASVVLVSARQWALDGYVEQVDKRTKRNKDGSVTVTERVVKRRSERLMERFLVRHFPEFRQDAATTVNVNVNPAEERREILVVVSDPEARAAIRRARDRALLPAGGAGESGDRGDGRPPV